MTSEEFSDWCNWLDRTRQYLPGAFAVRAEVYNMLLDELTRIEPRNEPDRQEQGS